MRRMRMALAVCLSIAMTLAQACVGPSQGVAPYQAPTAPVTNTPAAPSSNPNNMAALPNSGPPATHIDTKGYHQDQSTSQALTDYLTQHKLPLVGAQVLTAPDGTRAVVLYGFTGSDMGKQDAIVKARKYLNDSSIAVDNRIKVNPELLTANNPASAAGQNPNDTASNSSGNSADASAYPGAQSYVQHQNDAQQYAQAQGSGASMGAVSPMLLMGLVALSIASGGMISIGGGPGSMGGGSFGGGSFGGAPFGGSPFGGAPFGGAPYNPYPGYPSGSPSGPLGSP